MTETLWVPFDVLNASDHRPNTRLIWVLLGIQWPGNSPLATKEQLRKLSGLTPKTISLARAKLVQAPLAPCYLRPHPSCAAMPMALLTNAEISPGARLLYGQLQGLPHDSFTYVALSHLTGSSDDTLRRAVAELAVTGWLAITQTNRKSPIHFTLRNPVATLLSARISRMKSKVRGAQHRGKALLREFLNAILALDRYEDNASPDFLLDPYTEELMELDRYYPTAAVAFEYHGAQRYEVTELATFEETVKQVGYDAAKAFICKAWGIELVIIHPEELSWKGIQQKIPVNLPRRDLRGLEPLVTALEVLALEYREAITGEAAHSSREMA